jgi:2-phospho-L-lactate/phosphoenolpyruvate guanylyltransferase
MRTAAILPVKRFAAAKQRLGASVADELRLALAQAMVADVMHALAQTEAIERTIVVTGESAVTAGAGVERTIVVADDADEGQSSAAALGIRRALADGMQRALCVPGDCPALDPVELGLLLAPAPGQDRHEPTVVIVPDRHGTGTNGLLLSPPDAIAPSFGPGSCARHRALALAAGIVPRIRRPRSLLLDIDTSADLDALRRRLAHIGPRAQRTREVLARRDPPRILSITTTA